MSNPSYREELISQIPAAQLLVAMGYHYLTPAQALAMRGGNERNVILKVPEHTLALSRQMVLDWAAFDGKVIRR